MICDLQFDHFSFEWWSFELLIIINI